LHLQGDWLRSRLLAEIRRHQGSSLAGTLQLHAWLRMHVYIVIVLSCAYLVFISTVQLDYTSKPNLLYKFKSNFNKFLEDGAATKDDFPNGIDAMADDYGIKLVESHGNTDDVDRVGFVPCPT
jgi:hypothetical protein